MPPHVVIVGSGVSAAALVVQLLRKSDPGKPMVVTVLEKDPTRCFWAGVAYGTAAPWHLINVPCSAMSAIADDPTHLVEWVARRRGDGSIGGEWGVTKMHIPRGEFGRYLRDMVEGELCAARAMKKEVKLILRRGEAVAVRPLPGRGNAAEVVLSDGTRLHADHAVLCTGNFSPENIEFLNCGRFYSMTQRYFKDPWRRLANLHETIPSSARVCLIGSRLTAVDVLLTLRNTGHTGPIHIISRKGLLPFSNHAEELPPPYDAQSFLKTELPEDVSSIRQDGSGTGAVKSVDAIFHRLQRELEKAEEAGIPWQSVIDSMRPYHNRLWLCMSTTQRKRFLSEWRDFWEVRRHRVAPGIMEEVLPMLDRQQAVHHVGRVVEMQHLGSDGTSPIGIRINKTLQDGYEEVVTDWVINCTGPQLDFRRVDDKAPSALFAQLVKDGLVLPEETGIGLLVDVASGRLLTADDLKPSPILFAIGPVRKGSEWETIAVREIRVQALQVANGILSSSASPKL
eukprot:Sspe_Gene.88534::Locus_60526_Transcript_1_1_Confidence_1.000_Length_1685::g.88534::m.88534